LYPGKKKSGDLNDTTGFVFEKMSQSCHIRRKKLKFWFLIDD
jgi:hypothetical protein